MLAAASIAAIALFPPKELAQFGLSAAAAAAFCSNIFFAFQTNYFAGPDTMMPLLHTWSLGVEEQFYIVWPLLLFICYRLGSRLAVSVLVVALRLPVLLTPSGARRPNMPPNYSISCNRGRGSSCLAPFWRLGLVPRIGTRWLRDGLALLGIGMIAFAVTQFSSITPFPGLWATIPCLGAMLVIHTGQQRDTAVYRLA